LIECSWECDLCNDGVGVALVVWYWRIRSAAGVPCGVGFGAYCSDRCRYGVLMLSLGWCRLCSLELAVSPCTVLLATCSEVGARDFPFMGLVSVACADHGIYLASAGLLCCIYCW